MPVYRTKRSKDSTKLIREITFSASEGGEDQDLNPRLRSAVQDAKSMGMPVADINRAINIGGDENGGVTYEEFTIEGYGPGRAAMLLESITDDKNRTIKEIRKIFTENGGSWATNGSVAQRFESKGYIILKEKYVMDDIKTVVEDAADKNVEEDRTNYGFIRIYTDPDDLESVLEALDRRAIHYSIAEVTMVPTSRTNMEGNEAQQMNDLIEALENCNDIQKIFTDADIPDYLEPY